MILELVFVKHFCTFFFFFFLTETPDSVSMSEPSQTGPLVEGENYRMQCDIVNVAPVRNLSVHWHKGNEVFYTETFNESSVYPVNKSSVLDLTAHRDDNGTQIWCEAKLNFWPTGPNVPSIQSQSHEPNVLCKFLMPP